MQKRIEKIKDIILVVLFFSAILLLYFFWENQLLRNFQLADIVNSEDYKTVSLDEVIVPDSIYASSGNGVYVKVYGDKRSFWKRGISEIQKFGEASGIFVGEITKQQYLEAMSGYVSLQFDLGYEVPFSQFCDYYRIQKNQSFDAVEAVSVIAYSSASSESLFIVQEQKGKYYRLVADRDYTGLRDLAKEITQSAEASYYPISELMGVENTTMIPWEATVSYEPLDWQTELQRGEKEDVIRLAQSFFGENFDFIRRMVDTKGNVTYMYGYGQKTFITYVNGGFEYKEETGNASGGDTSFYGSLDTALQYISAHGSWMTFDGEPVMLFLSRAKSLEGDSKKKGYRFEFGLMAGDYPVYYDQAVPLAVEVVNGQVSYYHRNLVQYNVPTEPKEEVQTSIANILASNYRKIYQLMGVKEERASEDERFNQVISSITDARLGYFCSRIQAESTGRQEMRPAWVVTIDHRLRVFLDVKSGLLLGSRRLG